MQRPIDVVKASDDLTLVINASGAGARAARHIQLGERRFCVQKTMLSASIMESSHDLALGLMPKASVAVLPGTSGVVNVHCALVEQTRPNPDITIAI